jgi:hypothetical protein
MDRLNMSIHYQSLDIPFLSVLIETGATDHTFQRRNTMTRFAGAILSAAVLFAGPSCVNTASPGNTNGNTNTFVDAGVSADLTGTWKFYNPGLDSVVDGLDWVFSQNNITLGATSLLATGSKPVANSGNIGYALSSMTGYLYDYSLSSNKDSLYLVGDNAATAHPVSRDTALSSDGAGVWVKQ